MTGYNVPSSGFTVFLLIIKEDIGTELLQNLALVCSTQEENFVHT